MATGLRSIGRHTTSATQSDDRDLREHIDELLDEFGEGYLESLAKTLEIGLKMEGRPFKVREQAPESADPPKPCKAPKPDDPPRFRCFEIPARRRYDGLGVGGGILVCKLRYEGRWEMPGSKTTAERAGILGKWLMFPHADGADIMRLDRVTAQRFYGAAWLVEEPGPGFRTNCWYKRSGVSLTYQVIEVRPGRDREWRDDAEFVEALRRAGCDLRAG